VKVEVGLKCEIKFLTQHLGLSIFYPNLGWNNPARGFMHSCTTSWTLATSFVYCLPLLDKLINPDVSDYCCCEVRHTWINQFVQ